MECIGVLLIDIRGSAICDSTELEPMPWKRMIDPMHL